MTEKNIVQLIDPSALIDKERCPLSGSKVKTFSHTLANQVLSTLWVKHSSKEEKEKQVSAALVGMMAARPQDELEGMLAAQMVAAHNAVMECFRRSMHPEQTFEGRKENLNQANKLTRSYAAMLEALGRYRGKGVSEQRVIVQHVNVAEGGQAIVGSVSTTPGGGAKAKTEEQPHAK